MKKIFGTLICALITLIAVSQPKKVTVSGSVIDATTKQPVTAASVFLNNRLAIADDDGKFHFSKITKGIYDLKITSVGYSTAEEKVSVDQKEITLTIKLKIIPLFLQPLEVKSLRVNDKAPFAKTNLSKEEIAKSNFGQDLPFLLNQTPSVVVNSDAGNGVGYTGIHIRGTDATRINVTLNGIPYNDAESQGVYFVDVPDMASSANSIQIQRGVGTSSNGTGAFGATINLSTNEFNEKAYGEFNNSYGSFNTWKNTVKAGSGLIDGHFTVDARLSQVSSDGYIDRATSNLKSFAFSTAYISKNSSLRFNIFSGKEKTYQAWDGVPQDSLATNRTYNDLGTEKPGTPYSNQTDNYQQDHYQLFFNHSFNSRLSLNTAVFMTYGRGYYEEYKGVAAETANGDNSATSYAYYGLPNVVYGNDTITNTDLVRQLWLDNHFYGQIFSLQYKTKKDELTFGGCWTRYQGTHYGTVIWAQDGGIDNDYQYYNHPDLKTDEDAYVKWQHKQNDNWQSFIDVQYRHAYHRINGFEGDAVGSPLSELYVTRTFDFINPKAGITYSKNGWQAYLSYALSGKEPNYSDFESTISSSIPKSEILHDFELGVNKNTGKYSVSANVYYMYYHDQLIATGKLNDVGESVRVNVPNSYRAGVELQGGYIFTNWLNASANLTVSKNKIKTFDEYLFSYDDNTQHLVATHNKTDISFSPSLIGGATINILPCKHFEISLLSKYVGKQYLDNTQEDQRAIDGYFTQDVRFSYSLKKFLSKELNIIAQVNNVFNNMYLSSGAAYPYIYNNTIVNDNYYFPMAGTNIMVAVNVKF